MLALLCAGHADGEVADRLGIARDTVYRFRSKIRTRLGVASLAEACRRLEAPGDEPDPTR